MDVGQGHVWGGHGGDDAFGSGGGEAEDDGGIHDFHEFETAIRSGQHGTCHVSEGAHICRQLRTRGTICQPFCRLVR